MTHVEHRSSISAEEAPDIKPPLSPGATRLPLAVPAVVSVEMWERFSFYGMQSILAYYLYGQLADGGIGLERGEATALVGSYGAFLYLCTFVGGWIGDHILGPERTLLTGAGALMAGHLALSTSTGLGGAILGLIPIAVGSGFLKTAAITMLNAVLRGTGTPEGKVTGVFQVFYSGINIGGVLGPLLCGWLAARHGFHAGFVAAAVLMGLGLCGYLALRSRMLSALPNTVLAELNPRLYGDQPPQVTLPKIIAVCLMTIGVIAVGLLLYTRILSPGALANGMLTATVLTTIGLFATMLMSTHVSAAERRRVVLFVPLFIASTLYWFLFGQVAGVLAVYSDLRLDRIVGGFEIPPSWTQSLNSFWILVLVGPFAALLNRLGDKAPRATTLMPLGLIIAGLTPLPLLFYVGQGEASTPFVVFALAILLLTTGEMLIGPTGMASTGEYAPAAFRTRFSALFFLSIAVGSSLAGAVSPLYNPESATAESWYLCVVAAVPIVVGMALWALGRRGYVHPSSSM